MPPIALKLDATSYAVLYTFQERAQAVLRENMVSASNLLTEPEAAVIADMNLKNPNWLVFPKKGKVIRLKLSQAVAMLKMMLTIEEKIPAVLLLIGMLDRALMSYHPHFGYRNTTGPYQTI